MVLSFQNCSEPFVPLVDKTTSLLTSTDPFAVAPPTGPAPKILEAKIVGDNPFPVFLDEFGTITTRDPTAAWRFRKIMGDKKFRKLGTYFTNGEPKIFCAIDESGQPHCRGQFKSRDLLTNLAVAPEPLADIVSTDYSIFVLGDSGKLYFLDLNAGPGWTEIFPDRRYKKILPFVRKPLFETGRVAPYTVLTVIDTTGRIRLVQHSFDGLLFGACCMVSNHLSMVDSLHAPGALDVAPSSDHIVGLYPNGVLSYCEAIAGPAGTGLPPCETIQLPAAPTRLWTQNPHGRAGCLLSSENKPFCFAKTYQGLSFLRGDGTWVQSQSFLSNEPVQSVDFATDNSHLIVTVDSQGRAKVLAQASARLGADLFARLGLSRTQFEASVMQFRNLDLSHGVQILNGPMYVGKTSICGPHKTADQISCTLPANSQIFGMPNSMKELVPIANSSSMLNFGSRLPMPKSGSWILGNDDILYSMFDVNSVRSFTPVLSVPGAKGLRCYNDYCQVDFNDGSSRFDRFVLRAKASGTTTWEPIPQAQAPLPPETDFSNGTYGGLTRDQRREIENELCGIQGNNVVCHDMINMTTRTAALPSTTRPIDIRYYSTLPCVISADMRMSCLNYDSVTATWRFIAIPMREPAVRFFGAPVYQGVSGKFYGIRYTGELYTINTYMQGIMADFEIKNMPPANTIVNVMQPSIEGTPWQAMSADGNQGVVIEKTDGTVQYRSINLNEDLAGPFSVDVRMFQ